MYTDMPMRDELRSLKGPELKDDLRTIYETVQEVSYTEYTLLKLLERVREALTEVLSMLHKNSGAAEANYDIRSIKERTKEIHDDVASGNEVLKDRIQELSQQVNSLIEKLQNPNETALTNLAKSSHLLIQACKLTLVENGFDPETGLRSSQIDQDWKNFKARLAEFVWGAIFTLISSLIFWSYTSWQKDQERQQREQTMKILRDMRGENERQIQALQSYIDQKHNPESKPK